MSIIHIDHTCIESLDISPARLTIEKILQQESIGQELQFSIHYTRSVGDPRELSEIAEVRLWFIRLDATYPWLPYLLDWREELARYTAMLVPHRFSQAEGIEYYPEALEIYVMSKLCVIYTWLQARGVASPEKLQQMVQPLGYDIDRSFFTLIQ